MKAMAAAARIQRLDETVVNRIAAGEIIQRPANAIKELVENCLDAKSTAIGITVKDGGLKLLQIQDDGCGIQLADMVIVCERFTTSKLTKFEDLAAISTYGFRGEALASISHVAHVTITTRTASSQCGYRGQYRDGKLVEDLAMCASNVGTQIKVEDLFYNTPTRRKALKSPTDEHNALVLVVTKYAVHNTGVAFTLKKFGSATADVLTSAAASQIDTIRCLYGSVLAHELLQVSVVDEALQFTAKGWVTNANYSTKKGELLLFINHRLINSTAIKKALEAVYANYLPKNSSFFAYLSLEIAPANIDVNVHPTKYEVHFLHEENIVARVQKMVDDQLLGANQSRVYFTQRVLPVLELPGELYEAPARERARDHKVATVFVDDRSPGSDDAAINCADDGEGIKSQSTIKRRDTPKSGGGVLGRSATPRVYEHQLVRADSRSQTLHAFFSSAPDGQSSIALPPSSGPHATHRPQKRATEDDSEPEEWDPIRQRLYKRHKQHSASPAPTQEVANTLALDETVASDDDIVFEKSAPPHGSAATQQGRQASITRRLRAGNDHDRCDNHAENTENGGADAFRHAVAAADATVAPQMQRSVIIWPESRTRLTSVQRLRQNVIDSTHPGLADMFQNHIFVGCIDPPRALVQYKTRLYITNTDNLCAELFFQLTLRGFAAFSTINMTRAEPLQELLEMALNHPSTSWTPSDGPKPHIAANIAAQLSSRGDMLDEYFGLKISADGCLHSLPLLLNRFIPDMARLPLFLFKLGTETDWSDEGRCFEGVATAIGSFYRVSARAQGGDDWQWTVEHILYPAMRAMLRPPTRFAADKTVVQVADLHELYKVFERC